MATFTTIIRKFEQKGEKSGWTYIDIPADVAAELKPGNKKSFQVKGHLDNQPINGVSLLPMGDGNFIMALNATMRKAIRKNEGAMLKVQLEVDNAEFVYPEEIIACLEDEPAALAFFNKLPGSHRKWYIKWIESARTEPTRAKRIAQMVHACAESEHLRDMMRNLQKAKGQERL